MRLIFIRHGDPDYEHDSLTAKGRREAELLAERVGGWKADRILCSPLGRARETAEYSLKKLGMKAEVLDWLQEFYYPVADPETGKDRLAWDFMPRYWTRIPEFYDKDHWTEASVMKTGPISEKYRMVCDGIDGILKEYGYERSGGFYRYTESRNDTVVIFCHLGVSYVMLSHLLGISPVVLWQTFFTAPTAVTVTATEERIEGEAMFRVQVMGDTSHLRAGGEPVSASGYFTDAFQK